MRASLCYRRNKKPVLHQLYNTKYYKTVKTKRNKITNGIKAKMGQPLTQEIIKAIEQGVVHDIALVNMECSQYYSCVTGSVAKVKSLQQIHRYKENGETRKLGITNRATPHVAPGASSDSNSTYWNHLHITATDLLQRSYKTPLINKPDVVLYDLVQVLCTIIADEFEQDKGVFDCIALVWMDEFYPTSKLMIFMLLVYVVILLQLTTGVQLRYEL